MDFFNKNKTLTSVLILAVFLIAGFFIYSSTNNSSSAVVTDSTETDQVTQALLVTLANLHSITLDGSIFSDPVFLSLNDYGVIITPQPSGRHNPFQPIGIGNTVPAH